MIRAVSEVSSQCLLIANVPESVKQGKHKLPVLYGTGLSLHRFDWAPSHNGGR